MVMRGDSPVVVADSAEPEALTFPAFVSRSELGLSASNMLPSSLQASRVSSKPG
jgi:hypothetical protein